MSAVVNSRNSAAAAPLREGRAPVRERLVAMLLLAAALHAIVILGLTFTAGGGGGATPQLDVLLVTNEVPEAQSNESATYLAQRTQLGSGNTDRAAAVTRPASRGAAERAPESGSDARAGAAAAEREQQPVLSSNAATADIRYIGEAPAVPAANATPEPLGYLPGEPRAGQGEAVELLLRGKSNAEHWVTPDTKASAVAPYLASWKRKVERIGNLNLPPAVRTAGLSGSPVVEVEIGANGRLRQATVRRSSGSGALDQAALTILRLASPFEPFPSELSAQYSQLRFAYEWDFVGGALQPGAVTVSSDARSGP